MNYSTWYEPATLSWHSRCDECTTFFRDFQTETLAILHMNNHQMLNHRGLARKPDPDEIHRKAEIIRNRFRKGK